MLDCCGLGWVNQRTIVLLAWIQAPALSCSHILGTHEFPRDTFGTTVPNAAFSLFLPSPESQEFWTRPHNVCSTSQAYLRPRPRSSEETTGHDP